VESVVKLSRRTKESFIQRRKFDAWPTLVNPGSSRRRFIALRFQIG